MTTDAIADEELLRDIAAGSETAMQAFYQQYSDTVYRFAMKTLRNPVDAAEVLNEVMLAVWQKPDGFQGRSKVSTWLYGITHNKAVDAVRKKARHDGTETYNPEQHGEDDDVLGCELFRVQEGVENSGYVRQCLDRLSDAHRQVVYLTFFEELSYPEIAEVLSVPAGTIKTRMMHAKKSLLRCIQGLLG